MNSLSEMAEKSMKTAEQLVWAMDSWMVLLLQAVLLGCALYCIYKIAKEWGIVR